MGGQCTLQTLNRCDGQNSRLFAAKQALNNALNAHAGNIDFGLEVFDFQLCPFNNPLCTQCDIGPNGYTCLYTNNQFTKLDKVNWISQACLGPGRGGRILVPPGADSANKIFPWIDGVENHRDSGDGNNSFGTTGTPVNPEIRAMGNTPIAESLLLAKTDWYDKVRAGDPFIDCRPYAVVVATDGEQSVNGGCGADPVNAPDASEPPPPFPSPRPFTTTGGQPVGEAASATVVLAAGDQKLEISVEGGPLLVRVLHARSRPRLGQETGVAAPAADALWPPPAGASWSCR